MIAVVVDSQYVSHHRTAQAICGRLDAQLTSERDLASAHPSLVHVISPYQCPNAVRIARGIGVPVVANYQPTFSRLGRDHQRAARAYYQVDLALAPEPAALTELQALRLPCATGLWGRGVDDLFHPRGNVRSRRPRLGYAGRLAFSKNLEHLVDVADLGELIIVGDGPARAMMNRLLPDATFAGQLHGEELAQTYASLDLFINPSVPFVQSIQEAAACGVPILTCSDIDYGVTCAPEELRANAVRLLADQGLRRSMSTAGLAAVRTWDAVVAELIIHYASLGVCL